ncbi:flavin-containing monooxygenase [Egicoccus sp. AB-alg6-2]|uniref:flavin-containing monooxygenase n=1 Tax=Egicoccus sp. AB-alg6-2 TaxID=3242692 RepID=UPI00359EA051
MTGSAHHEVVVVGAGPAGLATAACLARRGIGGVVVDKASSVGAAWRSRYDRLHLHTPRVQSALPGMRIPRSAGRWVSRDDFVAYLEAYAERHHIRPWFDVEVERLERAGDHWEVTTSAGTFEAEVVVLATGYNGAPFVPSWPGRETFTGTLVHASTYRTGAAFAGRDVLVVGSGNTGAEIAVDLVEQGAGRVLLAIRSAPHVVPRTVAGVPTTLLGIPNQFAPPALADPVNRALQRLTVGDLTPYGLPSPEDGLVTRFRASDVVPIIDVGLVAQLRAGRIEPVAAVAGFEPDAVLLENGTRVEVDAVVAATGYRTGLAPLVGHLGILDTRGRPTFRSGTTHPAAPDLHLVGLRNPLIGLLNAIRRDAERVARAVADSRHEGRPGRTHRRWGSRRQSAEP